MTLTTDDLQAIRKLIREEVRPIVQEEVQNTFQTEGRKIVREEIGSPLTHIEGRLIVIENDIKEIYDIFTYNGLKVVID